MLIGLPYTINFTDESLPGKTPFVIEPNTTNGPLLPNVESPDSSATEYNTSITLPGMGLIQYGERVNETLVHMLEHFASRTPPVHPTIGQQWYDYGTKLTKVWDGVAWSPIGSNATRVASANEFNSLLADVNYVIGNPGGNTAGDAHGYGQTPIAAVSGRPVTTLEWVNLINAIRKASLHQGTTIPTLVDTDFTLPGNDVVSYGIATVIQMFTDLKTAIAAVKTNCRLYNPATLETDLSGAGTFQRNTSWSGTIEHQVRLTFTSDAHARAYFNTGGLISFSGLIDQPANGDDIAFGTMLNNMGVTKLSAFGSSAPGFSSGVGFYSLTNTDQTFRTVSGTGNKVELKARYDVSTFSVTIRAVFTASPSGNMYSLYNDGIIGGHLLSSIGMQKASEMYINSPELAYPQVSTIRSLN